MANPYLEALDRLESQEGSAPVAAPNPYEQALEQLDQEDRAKDEHVRQVFGEALSDNVDRRAAILQLAERTGAQADFVERHFDLIRSTWEASQFDPRRWREQNRNLAALLAERPHLGRVAVVDQEVPRLVRWFRQWGEAVTAFEAEAEAIRRNQRPPETPEELRAAVAGWETRLSQHEERWEAASAETRSREVVEDERAREGRSLTGLERLQVPVMIYRDAHAQIELSRLGREALFGFLAGQDTWETEKAAAELRKQIVDRDYGESALVREAMELAPSQVEVLKGGGIGGLTFGALGALGGALFSRSLAGARAGATAGAQFGAKAGASLASFGLEAGSAFWEFQELTTDSGQRVSREEAAGAALIYGAAAAGIEGLSFGATAEAGKTALQALLAKESFRRLAARAAKVWAKRTAAETIEETLQAIAQDVVGYLARSKSAGELQAPDVAGTAEEILELIPKVATGTAVLGAGSPAATIATARLRRDGARRGAEAVAEIAKAAQGPLAQASPTAVADLIARATAETGEAVESVYIDPAPVIRLYQEQGPELVQELLGPDGERLLQEAQATGQQLELPLKDFVERVAPHPVAEQLLEHTTTRPGRETLAQLRERGALDEQMAARVEELAKEYEQEQTAPASEAEAGLAATIEEDLVATGRFGKNEVRRMVALWRAFLRTQAESFGVPADELFREYSVRVERGAEDAAMPPAAVAQDERTPEDLSPADVSEEALGKFFLERKELAHRDFWTDLNTGLLNARAVERIPVDPELPFLAEVDIEGKKAANDLAGHAALDALLRAAAQAIHGLTPWAGKVGGGIVFPARSEKHAREIVAQMQARMPEPRIRLFVSAAERKPGVPIRDVMSAIGKAGAGPKKKSRKKGKLAERGDVPVAFLPRDEQGRPIPSPRDAEDKVQVPAEVAAPFKEALQPVLSAERVAEDAFELLPDLLEASTALGPEAVAEGTFIDPETGLYTLDGWERLREIRKRPWVTSIDMALLRDLDAAFGREATDRLIAYFGRVLAQYPDFDFARLHGDEYAAQADNEQDLKDILEVLRADLSQRAFVLRQRDGSLVLQRGVYFGAGVAEDFDTADGQALADDKAQVKKDAHRPEIIPADRADEILASLPDDTLDLSEALPERAGSRGLALRRTVAGARGSRLEAGERPLDQPAHGQTPERVEQPDPARSRPRGFTDLPPKDATERLFKIVLNPSADLSTFLHESAHVFLEVLADLAQREDAPERVRQDWETTLRWLGVERREDLQRDHHEQWARGFEAFLLKGEAPSSALARAFERFKLWLKDIYRSVATLGVELNEEISGVFDRLLATDQELVRAQRAMGTAEPVFGSAEEMGVTPEEYQAYLDAREQATSHAARRAELRLMKDRLREQESWWREEEKKLREEAGREYEALPARRAWLYLRGQAAAEDGSLLKVGDALRLDRAAVEAILGPERAKRLPLRNEGGLAPDDLAQLLGFATGEEMIRALDALPSKKEWVRARAAGLMAERHPDLLEERSRLREEISKGLHGGLTEKAFLEEWKAMRRKAGVFGEPPIEAAKRFARKMVERRSVRFLDPGRALQAEQSEANKAIEAAAKGNYAQAEVFLQRRALNFYLYKELSAAREEREDFILLARQLQKRSARERLGKASPAYRDVVDQLLEALDLREPDPTGEPRASLEDALAALEEDGTTVMFDPALIRGLLAQPREWRQLTVTQMREVVASLKNIRAGGRTRTTVLVEGRRVERELIVEDLVAEAERNVAARGPLTSSEASESLLEFAWGKANALDGYLLKPETMVSWLAGGDLDSTWYKSVVLPLQEAKHREADLLKTAIKPIIDAFERVSPAVRARFMESVDGAALFPGHRADLQPPRRRFELLMLALNAGNESNLARLLEGRSITMAELRAAIDTLTKEELDWVQSVWDAADSLWPLARELEERDSGLAPPKIQALPLVTRHGTYRGGYFPAVYDRRLEQAGERQAARSLADLLDPSYTRPGTSHGHLKSRVEGFAGALALDPSIIYSHLAQVAHDIAFREAVKSVGSIVLDRKVDAVLRQRLGHQKAQLFLQWLKDVGSMRGAQTSSHLAVLDRLASRLRGNMAIAVLGWAPQVALGDLSNLLVGGTLLKKKHWAAGLMEVARHPIQATEMALEKSGELRFRRDQLQRDLARQVKQLTATGPLARGPLAWFRDHAFTFVEWSDRATSTPIWLGAYRQALAQGQTDEAAVRCADSIIRKAFPSHSAVDQAALLRDKGFWGLSTVFYGYLNVTYNLNRDVVHAAAAGDIGLARASGRLMALWISYGVVSELLTGRGPEEGDENEELVDLVGLEEARWVGWFTRKLLLAPLSSLPFPIANMFESLALGKRPSVRAPPVFQVVESLGKALQQATREDGGGRALLHLLRGVGILAGVPIRPLAPLQYLIDVVEGERQPEGPADLASGLIYGEREGQPANLLTLEPRER